MADDITGAEKHSDKTMYISIFSFYSFTRSKSVNFRILFRERNVFVCKNTKEFKKYQFRI